MAIKNSAAVYINGINLTAFTVAPFKWGNFLDEQLDEMYLALRHCPIENFKPLTPVEIHFKNELYFGSTTVDAQTKIKRYFVANDSNAEENPVGRKLYNHDLYLIEITKYAECIVVDTITFTNDLGRNYTKNQTPVIPSVDTETNPGSIWGGSRDPVTPSSFVTPLPTGDFYFPSAHTVFPYETPETANVNYAYYYDQTVYAPNGDEVFYNRYYIDSLIAHGEDVGGTVKLNSGIYSVVYRYEQRDQADPAYRIVTATYQFVAVQNEYPLKTLTITDVINRLLDVAEPLRQGENPRFVLNAAQAVQFDKILAPQFSFTKQTLRECLREIGGVVHGEPRLSIAQDTNGKYYYEVSFDLYGQTDRAGIWAKRYIQKTVSQVVDSYASYLDSNAENLVNQLDKYAGVIVEPYASGYKTVRTETMYARITDANMLIQTQYPIYTVEKVECGYIPGNGSISPPIDITPYVFESSIYNTRLSSYKELYPESKAFGITYTQGQKNLTALNFKIEDAVNTSYFSRYAIVNILRAATGNQSLNVSDYPLLAFRVTYTPFYTSRVGQTKVNYQDYPYGAALIYNQQSNVIESRYYGENLKGVIARIGNVDKSITYNLARLSDIPQAGQMFDEDYYISAVSVEFLPTYIKCTLGLSKDFNRLSQYIGISSVKRYSEVSQGQAVERNTLWKEYVVIGDAETADLDCYCGDEFLSAVGDTFLQTGYIKPLTNISAFGGTYSIPTETLGKDVETSVTLFNIQGQAFLRIANQSGNTVKIQYSWNGGNYVIYVNCDDDIMRAGPIGIWTDSGTYQLLSANIVMLPLPIVNLPVISSAFGNSLSFSWEYEDNYSAGAISQYAESGSGNSKVSGYFQNNYQYTDYYGRMYYYNFSIKTSGAPIYNLGDQTEIGTALPDGTRDITDQPMISSYGHSPVTLRKDNREKLQCNFQIDFVSNRKNLIIGSALAAYNPLIRGVDASLAAKLYIFDKPINKFINHAEAAEGIDLSGMTSYGITLYEVSNGRFSVTAGNFAVSGKAWAIISRQTEETETVEDEEGNVTTQTIQKGGDVLIAQNMDIAAGDAFPTVYFTKKRKIFKEDVWTANR